jgi:hypothetical protein
MTYRKPELRGYPAIAIVQASDKDDGLPDNPLIHSAPAYEADE